MEKDVSWFQHTLQMTELLEPTIIDGLRQLQLIKYGRCGTSLNEVGQREKTVALHARTCKPFHALARIHTHLHVLARICTHLHAPKIAICT